MNGKKGINYDRKDEREMNKEEKRKRKQANKQICTLVTSLCVRTDK
jgi:nucleosome binding factor SPN SPT16 subunit